MSVDETINEIVPTLANLLDLTDYELVSTASFEKGNNFLSVIRPADVKGRNKNGEVRTYNLIFKSALLLEKLRATFPLVKIFQREIYFYARIYPAFVTFQTGRNVTNPFNNVAKMYYSTLENMKETIVLEDLNKSGYFMLNKQIPMDDYHVSLVLKTYGKFHAISYALKDQQRSMFDDLGRCLGTNFTEMTKVTASRMEKEMDTVKSLFDVLTENKYIDRFDQFQKVIANRIIDAYGYKNDDGIIVHADCWCNNFMFKYEDEETPRKPTDVKLLDFQITGLGSPVFDISYFFFCSTDENIYNNFEKYINIYYDSLSEHTKSLGSDPNKVFPHSEFMKHWKNHSWFGFYNALLLLKVILTTPEEAVGLGDQDYGETSIFDNFNYKMTKEIEYKMRIKALGKFFVDNDLLPIN